MFAGELYIEFGLRIAVKFVRRLGTSDWQRVNATVLFSERRASWTGCILVVIRYKFRNAADLIFHCSSVPGIFPASFPLKE
jgi:hypothetical protein